MLVAHYHIRTSITHGDGMGNNVGPPAAVIEGDVRSLQQCCPQLFEVFGEDIAASRAGDPRSLGSRFAVGSKL